MPRTRSSPAQAQNKLPPLVKDPKIVGPIMKSVWQAYTATAEKYNQPGLFTAFIGYEWTSNAGGGDNLHRNIIYRDNKDKADQVLPVHHVPEREPRGPLEVDGRMGEEDRRQDPRDPAQRQPLERPDVRADDFQRRPADQGTRPNARQRWEPLLRGDADEGARASRIPSLSPTDDFAAYGAGGTAAT